MNKKIFGLTAFSLILISVTGIAQDDDRGLDLIIRTDDKIEIPAVTRQYEKIKVEPPKGESPTLEYEFKEVPVALTGLDLKIKVHSLQPDPLKPLYGNYFKAGFGNYVTPYLEGHVTSKRSNKNMYGLHFRHLSSRNGPVENSGFSNNQISLYGKYFMNNAALDGRLAYERMRHNFYGYNQELISEVGDDTIRQVYNILSARGGIRSTNLRSNFSYKMHLNYYLLDDRFEAREHEIYPEFKTSYWLADDKEIEVDGIYSYSTRRDSNTVGRHFFQLKPVFVYRKDKYTVRAGFNTAYTNDTVGNKFHLYPRLQVDAELIKDELVAFGGIEGEMQKNTLRSFVRENPWLAADVPLRHTNKAFEIFGGVKGNVFERLNYKARLAYQNYRNLWFIVNSPEDTSRFTIEYENGNATVLAANASASYDLIEKLRVGLDATFYSYGLSNVQEAWHRPSFEGSLFASYNLYKKIFFNTEIYYLSGITGRNSAGEAVDLPGIADLNVKADYRFSPKFSAFLEVNNILAKKYQRYLYYPVQGFNVLGGITYTF